MELLSPSAGDTVSFFNFGNDGHCRLSFEKTYYEKDIQYDVNINIYDRLSKAMDILSFRIFCTFQQH